MRGSYWKRQAGVSTRATPLAAPHHRPAAAAVSGHVTADWATDLDPHILRIMEAGECHPPHSALMLGFVGLNELGRKQRKE